jgi:hypothetical protein
VTAKGGGKMTAPAKKFAAGGIQVAIWENKGREGNNYYTVSFDKRYKDKEGNWKSTTSLKANDLPKAVLALEKAFEFVSLKEPEQEESQEKLAKALA